MRGMIIAVCLAALSACGGGGEDAPTSARLFVTNAATRDPDPGSIGGCQGGSVPSPTLVTVWWHEACWPRCPTPATGATVALGPGQTGVVSLPPGLWELSYTWSDGSQLGEECSPDLDVIYNLIADAGGDYSVTVQAR